MLDPATNLTCTCQPGFALSPALRGSPFTSTSLQCVPCPAGTSRRGPTLRFGDEPGACFPCATGTFSLEGWHNCAPCPANMQCTNGMVFVTSGHAFLNDQEAVDFATDLAPTYSGIGAGSGMPGTPDLFKADTPEEAPQPAQSSIATTCPNPFACIQDGSVNTSESTSVLLQTRCAVGHDPDSLLCAGCLAGYEHNPPAAGSAGDCRACPSTTTAASKVALLSLIAASLYVLVLVAWFHPKLGPGVLPPALLVTPVADSLEAVRRSWCGCCSSSGPARAKRGVPALSRRRPSAFSKPNPMERRAKGGSTAAETLPEGTELSLHPVAPGLLWTVSAPHLPIAERERSASMFALVKRVLPWDLPKWVLSWDSTNREAPTGAFHSLYNSMIATGRREMPVPVLFSAPPAMDTALRAFGGLALLMFLQFSARLSDTRLGADTQGESTSAVPHMASVFPVSAVEASCLVQSVVGGYSRFVLGAGLMLGTIPLAFGLALIAYTLLACVRASSRSHAIVTGSRSAAVTSGGPTKSAAPLAGASLDSVVGAWSVALASPQPAAFSHVFIAALVILIPTLVPAGISVIGAAVFATAPNGSGGHNLLSDFSVEAGTGEHAMYVLIAIGLGSLTAGLPLALALYSRQSCDAAMRSVARKTATLVGGAASIMGPLPNPSRLPRVGACSGHFSFAGLSWRVGGLLWGWHRPSAWWWQLWLFAAACCLALLPGVLANAWSRLYVANVITIVMWLVFEWRKPYAVHRLIGAPSALFPRAPRLALPPHLLYADRERKSSLPAITATGIFAGVHAAGQRAGRAVLSIEARLRTRLMRFLLFMLVVQASVAHMAYVWHASLFVGEGGSSDTAEATGSPSERLQEALEGINASRTLRAAILGLSWVQWGAMWLGIAACVVFLLPSLLRGVVLAVLGNASWLLSSAVDASLKLCDKHRAQSTAKPLSRRWGDSQRIIVPKGGKGRKATKKTGPAKAKTSKAVGDAATPAMKWGAGSAGEDTDISFSNPMLSKGVSKAKAQRERRASHGSRVLTAALTQGVNPMLQHSNRSRPSPVRLRALSRAGIYTASPKLKVLKSRASSRAARRVESEEKGDAQAAKRAASPATLEELRAASPGTVASQAYFNNPIRQPQVMTRISHKPSRRTSVAASKMRLTGAEARSSVFAGANPIRAPAETPRDVAGLLRSARTDARATLASALEAGQHPRLAARRRLPAGSASGDRAVARARGLRAGSPSARKTSSRRARSRQRALQL